MVKKKENSKMKFIFLGLVVFLGIFLIILTSGPSKEELNDELDALNEKCYNICTQEIDNTIKYKSYILTKSDIEILNSNKKAIEIQCYIARSESDKSKLNRMIGLCNCYNTVDDKDICKVKYGLV